MEAIRETLRGMVVKRAFEPGRLRHEWMAAAYERLVPVVRISRYHEPKLGGPAVRKECVCAR
jgi:hypothetical protein